jgi:hypothetical protein
MMLSLCCELRDAIEPRARHYAPVPRRQRAALALVDDAPRLFDVDDADSSPEFLSAARAAPFSSRS